jgi:hypothetical protein
MPPKPFNPPRRASTSGTKKPPGRPKGSTNSKAKANGITKPKPKRKSAEKKDTSRISAASRISFGGLPSLSPDSDLEVNSGHATSDEDDDAEEEEEEEEDLPLPTRRRKSGGGSAAEAKSRASMNGGGGGESEEANPLEGRKEGLPVDLLNVLLHQHFKETGKKGTKLTMGANKAVERYMETFVREAIARSVYERIKVKGKGAGALEVS